MHLEVVDDEHVAQPSHASPDRSKLSMLAIEIGFSVLTTIR
jgi:hypothetical protein